MKLVNLKIAGFRGFNEEQLIDLDGTLVIYGGVNGSGKSSIAEAIEWVLFGFTVRRAKGETISRREYANCYRNVHYKGSSSPFVEFTFRDSGDTEHTIRRELNEDESSNLFLDSNPVEDLSTLGISNLRDRPLILQHALHDFIFMRPKERYEVLSAMLGLEKLILFRTTVEEARNNLIKNYPKTIKDTIYYAKLLISKLEETPITKTIVDLLNNNEVNAAYDQLSAIASSRVPTPGKDQKIIDVLKTEYAAKQRSQLDWGKFSYSPIPVDRNNPLLKDIPTLEKDLSTLKGKLSKLVIEVAKSKEKEDEVAYKEFLRLGLGLLEKDVNRCPFCLAETLTPARIKEIKLICTKSTTAEGYLEESQDALATLKNSLLAHWLLVSKTIPKLPDKEEREKIQQLLSKKMDDEGIFLKETVDTSKFIETASNKKDEINKTIQLCQSALTTDSTKAFPDIDRPLKEYIGAIKALAEKLNAYGDKYSETEPFIKKYLSSTSEVSLLALLIEAFEKWSSILLLKYLDGIQDKLLELIRITRTHIEEKQKHILGERDKQIKYWYDLMNPGAGVGYDSIIPKTDALDLQGRTFGRLMMAAPNLSTVQLNCIGLAITLACTTREESPYGFIIIDDPIQSMDDEHSEAFKKSIIKILLDSGFQVVLLSQLDKFAESTDMLYRQSYSDVCLYRMQSYQVNGPIIQYGGPGIVQLLSDVKKNKDADNPDYRKNATQDLRKFVERFVKDLYVAETGNSISKRYRNAAWPRLNSLLRQCKSFDATDESVLKDTHDFTSQFLHDDSSVGKTVPSASQLKPHFDAMNGLLGKYKKKLSV